MDQEDRDNFRTIANRSQSPSDSSGRTAGSSLALDQHSCQVLAETICGCYRRDEAQNPEVFAAALSALLMDYPADIARLSADPRTGVVGTFPMGLPNIGQIKVWLDDKLSHRDKLQRLASLPKVEKQPMLPRPPLGQGALANVYVPPESPMYPRFVEKAKTADEREWRRDPGRPGIYVALGWIEDPQDGLRKHFAKPAPADDDLRRIYPPKNSKEEAA